MKQSNKDLTKREDRSHDGQVTEQCMLEGIEANNNAIIMNSGLEETPQKRNIHVTT